MKRSSCGGHTSKKLTGTNMSGRTYGKRLAQTQRDCCQREKGKPNTLGILRIVGYFGGVYDEDME